MNFDSLIVTLGDTSVTLPLVCSILSGALIGLEREYNAKPAGLRTHTLVCFASALMTLIGLRTEEWTMRLPDDVQIITDMARMPHAILTGIGFLGAGVIFREGASIQGLTTAASLWLSGALGIVFGAGLLEIGTIGTVAALSVLIVLRALQWITPPRPEVRLEIAVLEGSGFGSAQLRALLAREHLKPGPLSIVQDRAAGLRRYAMLVSPEKSADNYDDLAELFYKETSVQELSVTPLENRAGSVS